MRRGEIRLAHLEPVRGSEANQTRPVVVVSNNGANTAAERHGRGVVSVIPVTSNTAVVHPFQTLLPRTDTGLQLDSKSQAEQVRSIDVVRIGRRVGVVPAALMRDVDDALRLHLSL